MTTAPGGKLPETPFGVRLKAARKMAGLSMEDLARKLGGMVTKQAIGKYEKGRMMPTPEVLERLTEVLRIATWGASPLRLDDAEAGEILREDASFLFALEDRGQEAYLRSGLQGRLRNRLHLIDLERLSETTPKEMMAEEPAENVRGEAVPDYASLGARRARCLRAWESDSALNEIRFREGGRLSAKTESALKYRVFEYLQRYLTLESVLNAATVFENPLARPLVRTADDAEAAAAEVRGRWELGSGPIVNLLGLLEDKGIKVYETRGIEEFEGLSGRLGDIPFVAVSLDFPADRIRFTAAHELGHVLCGFSNDESPEGMCHAFGAALLLPKAALEKAFMPLRRKVSLGELGEIKEAFGISLQAIMYRAHGLGLVGNRQMRSFRETVRARGWTTEEPVAYAGKERATGFKRLLRYAVAADILELKGAAALAGVPPGELEKEIGDIF